ncbi:putative membrane protein YeiB [Curtobacterium sp. PhB25]|nr:putative membrane protein YeiB [Curtobacterium sp. PhB25]
MALDVIRGVALCGIIFVNIGPLTRFGMESGFYGPFTLGDPSGWLQLLVQQRFFPIFSLLFGIGFSIFLESAARRVARPRILLLRRLLILLVIGILFEMLQGGSALLPYAVVGLVVLLPSTWLPRWASAAAAVVLILASLGFAGGGLTLIPGMFLLGSCLTRYGLVRAIGRSRRGSLIALAAFTVVAVPLATWQITTIESSGFDVVSAAAGLAIAGVYVSLLSLLMTTSAARVLQTAFTPLGTMALTNYVCAAPLMLAAAALLDLTHSTSWTPLFATVVVILLVQWVASTLWLRYCTQGPLEWLWRWGTWGHRRPLRRRAVVVPSPETDRVTP